MFKLNGTAAYPRIDTTPDPVPAPPATFGIPSTIAAGAEKYGAYCAGCHGLGAISGFVTPDLRRSPYILSGEAFRSVIQDGILLAQGMPRFGSGISSDDAEHVRSFLVREANYIYGLQRDAKQTP